MLLLHESIHLLAGGLIGLVFWRKERRVSYIFLAVLISLAIDLDHFVDFFIYAFNSRTLDWSLALTSGYFSLSGQTFVPLHSYELVTVLFLICRLRFLALVLLIHILVDQIFYFLPLDHYFIFARIIKGFASS